MIETANPTLKNSRRGASHRGADKDVPSGSQVSPPPFVAVPPSPDVEAVTLIEDYASGDEGGVAAAPSLACRRQIDFVDAPTVLESP